MKEKSYQDLPEESAEDLYENAPCGYASFLSDGTIIRANQTLLKLLDYNKEEILGSKKIQDLFKIGGKIYFETHFFPLVKMQGFVREVNLDFLKKGGSFFPALVNVEKVKDADHTAAIYRASVIDITDRKKYELALIEERKRAERATRAKAEFLSTISHEIRTPLNAIVGIGNLLKKTELNDLQKEYARILQLSSGNLLELVNNLLDLSKLEAQKFRVEEKDFNLPDLLQVLEHTFRIKAAEKNIELRTEIPDNIPSHLLGDPVKLNQVLTNLLGNAIKFTHHGYVKLKTEITEARVNAVDLRFTVYDTGIGIPEDKLELIFSEFSQASYDVNLQYGGTGLGLTISQKLLQLHGSELHVKSEEGKGSEFSFDLTYKLSSQPAARKNNRNTAIEFLRESRARTLVVDDNNINLFLISQYLREWNLEHETVSSGEAAIRAVQENQYDLILMDLHMPKMDGYATSSRIRELKLDPEPAIIALSASGRGDVNLKMRRAGIQAYVPKPFDPLELQETMVHYLSGGAQEILKADVETEGQDQDTSTGTNNEPGKSSYDFDRFNQLSNGNTAVLEKLVDNSLKSLQQYRREFLTAVKEKSIDKLSRLIHKNAMTMHYLSADRLKDFIDETRTMISNGSTTDDLERKKAVVLEEFNKVIKALKALQSPAD